ncbi:MAG: hypothetical protein ACK6CP_06775 [Pseudanabaena sp.]|nr:hypothetical protein [Pseudanabaena sp. M090S1SP2A07QC]MCA6505676.1 hypothetical protein [Pseudanabaena sp. M172S2SP2A07QC]MCA6520479.1 hypothetical protein [Pseudanabaena sp. M051S1SP2A07QC]MCA6526442.1 hypothetical protein [Pseudanabaena sp. M179S2SP2A07QC]MCA6530185.1 hypothetical protein [Pseudanabaena sp. M125S2SP2A07QC]MCA6534826.1 hypothetical protein [Pseudanabaena sp. M176S2SP2A07QC]MCA6539767.1 hypothetical protein [Pseudanabaena sp. M037S2SP2A07QC]MCA6543717.1 hypothetical prot
MSLRCEVWGSAFPKEDDLKIYKFLRECTAPTVRLYGREQIMTLTKKSGIWIYIRILLRFGDRLQVL